MKYIETLKNQLKTLKLGVIILFLWGTSGYTQSQNYSDYLEVAIEIRNISKKENVSTYNISFANENIKLVVFNDEDSSVIEINKKKVYDSFNFYYNASLEKSLKEIKVLKSTTNKDFILVLPSISDEYPTFELIKFEKATNTLYSSVFSIETYEEICNKSKFKIREKGKNYTITIDKFKIDGVFKNLSN